MPPRAVPERPTKPGITGYESAWLTPNDKHVDLGDPVRVRARQSVLDPTIELPGFSGTFEGVRDGIVLVREDATRNLRTIEEAHVRPR